jgi:hypothetical protein
MTERLAPPEYLRQLPAGTTLALLGRHKPMRLHSPGWYQDRGLRALIDADTAAQYDAEFTEPRRSGRRLRTARAS